MIDTIWIQQQTLNDKAQDAVDKLHRYFQIKIISDSYDEEWLDDYYPYAELIVDDPDWEDVYHEDGIYVCADEEDDGLFNVSCPKHELDIYSVLSWNEVLDIIDELDRTYN